MYARLITLMPSIFLALSVIAQGATFTWNGSADGNWTNAANWTGGIPASATDTAIVFGNATQLSTANNLAGGLTLNSLLFGPSSGARIVTGSALTFAGTAPTLVSQSTDPGDVRLAVPIILNQTLTITGGPSFDAQLLFTSASGFSGTGGITWAGGLGFTNAVSTFTGPVQITGGVFGTNQATGLGSAPSVTVTSGGAFQLQGGISINKPLSLSGPGFGTSAALNTSIGGGSWAGAISLAGSSRLGATENSTLSIDGTVALGANTLAIEPIAGSGVRLFGAISGTGGLTKDGLGILNLPSGANTVPTNSYTGPTLITAGLVQVARNSAFGNSSLVTVQSGAEIELTSRTNGSLIPIAGTTITVPLNLAGRLSAGNPLGGSDGFSQTWSGPITLSGTAELAAKGFGAAGIISTLQTTGTLSLGGFTLKARPDATNGRAVVRLGGAISGIGALDIVTGSGSVVLDNPASTFTGSITVNGTLTIGQGDSFGNVANPVTFQGGSLVDFNNNANVGPRPWNITGSGGLTLVPSNLAHVIGAAISGIGPLTVTAIGTGTGGIIDLTNANSFTGGLVVGSSSTVRAGSDAAFGSNTGGIALSGGSLGFLNSFTIPATRAMEIRTGGGTISAPINVTGTVAANLTGPGLLTIGGGVGGELGGTVTLTGTNVHSGGVLVSTATLAIDSDARLGQAAGVLNIGMISGAIARSGRLLALNTLDIAATRTTSFVNARVDTNGFNVTFNQPISGSGLFKEGAGILRLNTANPNTSTTNVAQILGGTLRLGVNDALGTGVRISTDPGTIFDLNNFDHTVQAVEGAGDVKLGSGRLTMQANSGAVLDGVISGTGSVVLETGSFRLAGANTFTGGVTVRNGAQLVVLSTTGFGAVGNPVLLDNGGISTTTLGSGPVVIDATVPFTIGAGGASFSAAGFPLVVASALTGTAPIRISGGSGTEEVRFTNPANTFTSNLQLGFSGSNAVLGISANGSLGAAANVITLGDRFFDGETTSAARGTLRAFASFALPASRVIQLNGNGSQGGGAIDTNGFDVTVNGAISQLRAGIGFRKQGTGTLFLNGVNSFTGRTTVEGGELAGSGKVAALRIESGASVSPGVGAGVFETGDLTFAGGSTLALDFASPSSGDQLKVTGAVTLEGDVQLSLRLSYVPPGLNQFTVLLNDDVDPIDLTGGMFALGDNQLQEGETFTFAGATWGISYVGGTGNDVVLSVVPEPGSALLLAVGAGWFGARRRRLR